MEYNKIKNADKIIENSKYFVKDPYRYKNKWHDLFGNKNPISLELGMGRGEFIINMAKKYPNINFIGLELYPSQMVMATEKLQKEKITNLKLINDDARNIDKIFGKEISTIYLTFSEPWPKGIDEKNRFTHISYLKLYDKIFKKDKHIILKTDKPVAILTPIARETSITLFFILPFVISSICEVRTDTAGSLDTIK